MGHPKSSQSGEARNRLKARRYFWRNSVGSAPYAETTARVRLIGKRFLQRRLVTPDYALPGLDKIDLTKTGYAYNEIQMHTTSSTKANP